MANLSALLLTLLLGALWSTQTQALSDDLGLDPNHFNSNGVSVGFLPAWGESKSHNTASSLNALLPKPMAVVGAYAQIRAADPNMTQIEPYIEDLLKQPGPNLPVFALALMPSEGLAAVTEEVADAIVAKMAQLNSMGITVWLRYAHEMNGDWYAWGQEPEAFIASWNMVASKIKAGTTDTYMLWSPNEMYAYDNSTANPVGGYEAYWPGPDNVDMVGLSFYHYGGWERLNILEDPNEALTVMARFYNLFAGPFNKSFVLSETGAAYTRDAATGVPAPGNATEEDIKMTWVEEISAQSLKDALPLYKAFCWFEVIKDENAGTGTIVKEEDFRLITSPGNFSHDAIALMIQNNVDPDTSGAVIGAGASPADSTHGADASAHPSSAASATALLPTSTTLGLAAIGSVLLCLVMV